MLAAALLSLLTGNLACAGDGLVAVKYEGKDKSQPCTIEFKYNPGDNGGDNEKIRDVKIEANQFSFSQDELAVKKTRSWLMYPTFAANADQYDFSNVKGSPTDPETGRVLYPERAGANFYKYELSFYGSSLDSLRSFSAEITHHTFFGETQLAPGACDRLTRIY